MNDPIESNQQPSEFPLRAANDPPKIISAQELFGGEREICIDHEGERYVLRITRRGKLILQK